MDDVTTKQAIPLHLKTAIAQWLTETCTSVVSEKKPGYGILITKKMQLFFTYRDNVICMKPHMSKDLHGISVQEIGLD